MKTVLFDWNGTLLNDTPIWHASVQETFRAFGSEAPTIAEYFRELKGDYLDIYRSRGITADRGELNAVYDAAYMARIHDVLLEPGAKETLAALSDSGITLDLITMQKEEFVAPLLEKFGIRDHFNECFYHAIKKSDVIRVLVEKWNIAHDNCFLVGDTPSDIRHANIAGIVSVAYRTEHIPYELFAGEAKPARTIDRLEELIALTR